MVVSRLFKASMRFWISVSALVTTLVSASARRVALAFAAACTRMPPTAAVELVTAVAETEMPDIWANAGRATAERALLLPHRTDGNFEFIIVHDFSMLGIEYL